ncbi:MAG TPA: hypothetical protein VNA29_05685 [Sphingomicrobium sp.]|nr:hypothetical protein [Sphingomicrobium sp.]
MIRLAVLFAVGAAQAAAQAPVSTFESGRQLAMTPGHWIYLATPTGSEVRYGAVLSLRCDRTSRTITVTRPGVTAALSIATDMVARQLPVGGRLSANDPLLDAIAFSRGRFLVWGGSGPTLAIPAWPEAARSIEDCRS